MEEQNNQYESQEQYETAQEEAYTGAKKTTEGGNSASVKKEILSWIKIFLIAIVIAFFINNVIIINANVPSGSMEKTIMTGDRMIGLRTSYWFSDPQRGDIVIFKNPDNEEETFVKRLIGMPGDKVVIKDAKIYINDSKTPLKEDYLPEEWTRGNGSDTVLEYKVPKGCYFMLGDNRNISRDARYWTNTYVKRDQVIAKAKLVYWPWGNKGILKSADYAE